MTAEEYVKHYASGQGGYESVPIDIALRAIEYAKQEAKQQMMEDAVEATVHIDACGYPYVDRVIELYDYDKDIPLAKEWDKVKIVIIRNEEG